MTVNIHCRNKIEKRKTTKLTYRSLVTKENIDRYLSLTKVDQVKKDFLATVSKFDLRISIQHVKRGDEFFYKIWILKRGTKKRAHIKQYYVSDMLEEKRFSNSKSPLSLVEILWMIRINADVPDDFEVYCEMHFEDPSDPICRHDYLDSLRRAERFKKFMSRDEIISIPTLLDDNTDQDIKEIVIDLDDELTLKSFGYTMISLDTKEYDKMLEVKEYLDYYIHILESYGFDKHTGEFNPKSFPITRNDNQIKDMTKNIDKYNQFLAEYVDFLKMLIQKYKIKQSGNMAKKVAFTVQNDVSSKQKPRFITEVIDSKFFY